MNLNKCPGYTNPNEVAEFAEYIRSSITNYQQIELVSWVFAAKYMLIGKSAMIRKIIYFFLNKRKMPQLYLFFHKAFTGMKKKDFNTVLEQFLDHMVNGNDTSDNKSCGGFNEDELGFIYVILKFG